MRHRGFLLLWNATFCVSTMPIVSKLGLQQGISTYTLLVSRAALAALFFWVVVSLWYPEHRYVDRQGLWYCLKLSLVNSVSMLAYVSALSYLDVSLSIMLYTAIYIPSVMFFRNKN